MNAIKLRVALYESAPACFMLRVDDTVLVEQYHYGKLLPAGRERRAPVILGKDMPLFEYSSRPSPLYEQEGQSQSHSLRSPFKLLEDHFNFAFEQATVIDLT